MRTKPLLAAVCLLPLLATGCTGLNTLFSGAAKPAYATAKEPATQILATWRPARGTHGGRPTRGFAGNIMFFTDKRNMPVLVKGKVRVYVFDDQGSEDDQSKPIRQFEFDAPSWNTYAKMGKVGPAYQIFIPYPRSGSHEANCTLSLRLVPEDGAPTLFSDETHVTLEGKGRTKASDDIRAAAKRLHPDAGTEFESVKQSYEIHHERVVPKRIEQISHVAKSGRSSRNAAAAQRIVRASREESSRLSRQRAERTADGDDDLHAERPRRRVERPASRSVDERRHPLRSHGRHPLHEGRADDAPEYEHDETVIRADDFSPEADDADDSTEVIRVDMMRLHADSEVRRDKQPQRRVRRQRRHPLAAEFENEFDNQSDDSRWVEETR